MANRFNDECLEKGKSEKKYIKELIDENEKKLIRELIDVSKGKIKVKQLEPESWPTYGKDNLFL